MPNQKKVVYRFPEIVMVKGRLRKPEVDEGIDTGVSDGSGSLDVSASDAQVVGGDAVFLNVEVIGKCDEDNKSGYGYRSEDELKAEAQAMLRQDYCR